MIKCGYCGRENQDETQACPGCGTLPPPSTEDVQDEPARPEATEGLVECAIGVAEVAMGHVAGASHLFNGLLKLGLPVDEHSPYPLLEHAAALESVDMRKAIAVYKQIALDHPGTRAAEEANRNVQALRAAHPEL